MDKLIAIPSQQDTNVFFQYSNSVIPVNKLTRESIKDECSSGAVQYKINILVPMSIRNMVMDSLGSNKKTQNFMMKTGDFHMEYSNKLFKINWQAFLPTIKECNDGFLYYEQGNADVGKITIRVHKDLFITQIKASVEQNSPINHVPIHTGKAKNSARSSKLIRTSNIPKKSCNNCYFLNKGQRCVIHKINVELNEVCSRIQPIKIFLGGSASSK
jgi:hypothetical protein